MLRFNSILWPLIMLISIAQFSIHAQEPQPADSTGALDSLQTLIEESINKEVQYKLPWFHVHAVGGLGLGFLSADEIQELLGDQFGIGLDFSKSYGARVGFRNIFQFELNYGRGEHDFNFNSIRPDVQSQVIEMNYKSDDQLYKINPLFMADGFLGPKGNGHQSIWIVWGKSDVSWKDDSGDGFTGEGSVLGFEYTLMNSFLSLTYAMRRYDFEFDETVLGETSFDVRTGGSELIFEMKLGFGFGY